MTKAIEQFDTAPLEKDFFQYAENIFIQSEEHLDLPICKYTSLANLLFLFDGKFKVNNRRSFSGDKTEMGVYKRKWLKYPYFAPHGQKITDEQLTELQYHSKQEFLAQYLFVSSWTYDLTESYLMWKAYTSGGNGVRIETTLRKLLEVLKSNIENCKIFCAKSSYEKLRPKTSQFDKVFLKQEEYKSEQEYRITIVPNNLSTARHQSQYCIDFSDGFIDKIVLSPFMSTSDVKDLKRMLESIDQYAKVKESNITA